MPLYLFSCKDCAHKFEKLLPFSKIDEVVCEKCSSKHVERVYDGATVFGSAAKEQAPLPACDRGCPGCPNARR